jgi:hypothetical protein
MSAATRRRTGRRSLCPRNYPYVRFPADLGETRPPTALVAKVWYLIGTLPALPSRPRIAAGPVLQALRVDEREDSNPRPLDRNDRAVYCAMRAAAAGRSIAKASATSAASSVRGA